MARSISHSSLDLRSWCYRRAGNVWWTHLSEQFGPFRESGRIATRLLLSPAGAPGDGQAPDEQHRRSSGVVTTTLGTRQEPSRCGDGNDLSPVTPPSFGFDNESSS